MRVRFRSSFKKDLKRIKDKTLLAQVSDEIENAKPQTVLPIFLTCLNSRAIKRFTGYASGIIASG